MKSALSILLYFVISLTLRAEISVGASLEWLADTSASVGIYQVTESRHESDSAFQLFFRLDEKLKGAPPQSATSPYWVRLPKGAQPPSVSTGERFLIFLKHDKKDAPRVAHLINLSKPQTGGMDSVAINCKFEVLTDQSKILEVVKERIKTHPTATPTKLGEYPASKFDVEVPFDTPAHQVLYSGSTCYLFVPEDLKAATKQIIPTSGAASTLRRLEQGKKILTENQGKGDGPPNP